MSVSLSSKRGDIIRYLHRKLAVDRTPDAMDRTLEADILGKIPNDILKMCITCFDRLSSANRLLAVWQKSGGGRSVLWIFCL